MKKYAVIEMDDIMIQHLGVSKTLNDAMAIAYSHMNDVCKADGDSSVLVTPLENLEGDTGYVFTYTQAATDKHVELKTTIYILEYDEPL